MEVIFIIAGIIAFIWIAGSVVDSNDRKKEEERQIAINQNAKKNMVNHSFLEKREFCCGWAVVKLEDFRYAYINESGKYLNNEIFVKADDFIDGTAVVRKYNLGVSIINTRGEYLLPFDNNPKIETYIEQIFPKIYKYTKTLYSKPSYVQRRDIFLVKQNGEYILDKPVDEIIEIRNNYIKIRIGKLIGEIDFSGQYLSRPFSVKVDLGDGLYRVKEEEYGWGIFDSNLDKIIIPCKYSEILYFKPFDIFILKRFGDGVRSFPCSIVNRNNEVIIPPKYEEISILEHKYIQVSYYDRERGCGLKSGIIDLKGNEIVKPRYGHIWSSGNSFMVAEFDGRCGFVSPNGISDLEYDSYKTVYISEWDCSSIRFGGISFGKGEKYPAYSESFSCKPTYLIVSKNGKYGVVDLKNSIIVPIIYDSITTENDSNNVPAYYLVNKSSLFGMINLKGEIVIPFKYRKISYHREFEDEFVWGQQELFDFDDEYDYDDIRRDNKELREYERYLKFIKDKKPFFECTDINGETTLLDGSGNLYLPSKRNDPIQSHDTVAASTKRASDDKPLFRESVAPTIIKQQFLFFDTETTGIPAKYNAPSSDLNNWPRLVQIAWVVADENGKILRGPYSQIIKPSNFIIPQDASQIHGISQSLAMEQGESLADVLSHFSSDVLKCSRLIGHNISFDIHIVSAEFLRIGKSDISKHIESLPSFCTMRNSVDFCKIPGNFGYKYPKLSELYAKLFGEDFKNAHDACADILATLKCYYELKKRSVF